jgi:hypothetical protein
MADDTCHNHQALRLSPSGHADSEQPDAQEQEALKLADQGLVALCSCSHLAAQTAMLVLPDTQRVLHDLSQHAGAVSKAVNALLSAKQDLDRVNGCVCALLEELGAGGHTWQPLSPFSTPSMPISGNKRHSMPDITERGNTTDNRSSRVLDMEESLMCRLSAPAASQTLPRSAGSSQRRDTISFGGQLVSDDAGQSMATGATAGAPPGNNWFTSAEAGSQASHLTPGGGKHFPGLKSRLLHILVGGLLAAALGRLRNTL